MKFLNKYNVISWVLLLLILIVQLIPFSNSTKLNSEVEDPGKTWAELPVGQTGKDKSDWPSEIKYGEFKDWDPSVQEKYPLYGERSVSIFTYVWNPAGALSGKEVNAYIFTQVLFIALLLFTFLVRNFMAKAVVLFITGIGYVWAFARTVLLNGEAAGSAPFSMVVAVLLLIIGLGAIAAGIYFIPEHFRQKALNEEIRKSL